MENKDVIEFKMTRGHNTISYKIHDLDVNLPDLLDHFKQFVASMGYHPDNINAIDFVELDN